MRIGILGYPQSGKTTLFNVLSRAHAPTGLGAASSGAIQIGTVQVPDPRLEALRDMFEPKKYTPARIEYIDLAGQADTGRNQSALLPQQITSADLILLVVRAFDDPAVHHPEGSVDPMRDVSNFTDELLLKDMAVVEGRIERLKKAKGTGAKEAVEELPLMERLLEALEAGTPLRDIELRPEEEKSVRGYQFITAKPLLVVFNTGDGEAAGAGLVEKYAAGNKVLAVEISGKAEMEIADLEGDEQREFMELLGITSSGLDRVIAASYGLLGVCSFFTVGADEVRAWTIPDQTPAVEAAGAIHSDLQRGFIRAEVVGGKELLEVGGMSAAKEKNLVRLEGKEYLVQDGDILNIRFSV